MYSIRASRLLENSCGKRPSARTAWSAWRNAERKEKQEIHSVLFHPILSHPIPVYSAPLYSFPLYSTSIPLYSIPFHSFLSCSIALCSDLACSIWSYPIPLDYSLYSSPFYSSFFYSSPLKKKKENLHT